MTLKYGNWGVSFFATELNPRVKIISRHFWIVNYLQAPYLDQGELEYDPKNNFIILDETLKDSGCNSIK